MSVKLNEAINHEIETCDARLHRWSEAQMKQYKEHLLNDPEVKSALDKVDSHHESSFGTACYQSYKRWAKAKAVIGNHMHNYCMDYSQWAGTSELKNKWIKAKWDTDTPPGHSRRPCIVLVHVGMFYEAYHQDADTLHKIFGAPYTYGYVARNGFPASKLQDYLKKLEEEGYSKVHIISV